jgi:hypothetical protein
MGLDAGYLILDAGYWIMVVETGWIDDWIKCSGNSRI